MLQKILFGLCLLPTLAFAESVCLEGPLGGNCHRVETNGEAFKPARTNTVSSPVIGNKLVTTKSNPSNANKIATRQQVANNRRTFRVNTAEQRVRQRAQIIEARAQARRNLATANNN